MLTLLAHTAITYLVPLLCGSAAALLVRRVTRSWPAHACCCCLAVALSLFAQYGCMLVLAGAITGNWPQLTDFAGLWYAMAWFALVAGFTTVPLVATSYAVVNVIDFAQSSHAQSENQLGNRTC